MRGSGGNGPANLRPGRALSPAKLAAGVYPWIEEPSFDSSPTGRFGISAVSERTVVDRPARAQGTPLPVLIDAPAQEHEGAISLDGPTLDHMIPEVRIEDAPLDRDATERGLLAAIASGDDSCRLSYADWLEARDEHARASFLRLEQLVSRLPPGDPRLEACMRQLRELAPHIDAAWRARVARPRIEGCSTFAFRCPRRWDALARTDSEAVRYCSLCVKHVFYYENADDARAAARLGQCVAIDVAAERWEDDLVELGMRCERCARRTVSSARFCPHCGASLRVSEEYEICIIEGGD